MARRRRERGLLLTTPKRSRCSRGDLTVLLVEQHVGFALRSTDSYYVLESSRITGHGDGGDDALDAVCAAMAV